MEETLYNIFINKLFNNVKNVILNNLLYNNDGSSIVIDNINNINSINFNKVNFKKFLKIVANFSNDIYNKNTKDKKYDKFLTYKINDMYSYNSIEYYIKTIIDEINNPVFDKNKYEYKCKEFYICLCRHYLFKNITNISIDNFYFCLNKNIEKVLTHKLTFNNSDLLMKVIKQKNLSIDDFYKRVSNYPKTIFYDFKEDIYKIVDIVLKFEIISSNECKIFASLKNNYIKIYNNLYQNAHKICITNIMIDFLKKLNHDDIIDNLAYNYQAYDIMTKWLIDLNKI